MIISHLIQSCPWENCGNYSEMKLVQNGVEGRGENLKFRSGCPRPLHILSSSFHVVVWAKNVQIRKTHVQYKGTTVFAHEMYCSLPPIDVFVSWFRWGLIFTDCQKLDNCRFTFSNTSLFGKSPSVKFLWPIRNKRWLYSQVPMGKPILLYPACSTLPIPVLWSNVDLTVSQVVPSPRHTPHLSSLAPEWRMLSQPTCYQKSTTKLLEPSQ